MSPEEIQNLENRLWEDEGIDVQHILTERGCIIALNGQGHFPCSAHTREAPKVTKYDPADDPDDYEVDPEEAGGPNEDGPQDDDVPDATYDEAANMGENPEADSE